MVTTVAVLTWYTMLLATRRLPTMLQHYCGRSLVPHTLASLFQSYEMLMRMVSCLVLQNLLVSCPRLLPRYLLRCYKQNFIQLMASTASIQILSISLWDTCTVTKCKNLCLCQYPDVISYSCGYVKPTVFNGDVPSSLKVWCKATHLL